MVDAVHAGRSSLTIARHLMFMFTINIGGAFIDFFDQFAGALRVDGAAAVHHRRSVRPSG